MGVLGSMENVVIVIAERCDSSNLICFRTCQSRKLVMRKYNVGMTVWRLFGEDSSP